LSENILEDADLAGPLCFCLLFGSCLLLSGKVRIVCFSVESALIYIAFSLQVQFGYIYGFSVFGCLGMHSIINLMHPAGLDFWRTCSVLGYCLIPVIGLAAVSILISLKGWLGLILAILSIVWSTSAATRFVVKIEFIHSVVMFFRFLLLYRMFEAKLGLTDQYWLVAYPTMLMYSCFVLITIF
jgi:hypothetical protein